MNQGEQISAFKRLSRQIDIPIPMTIWVFTAHAITLFAPLLLLYKTGEHAQILTRLVDHPFLFEASAVVLMVGSAFEISQNTVDRWYYTGPYPAFADLLFNWLIATGLGLLALAAWGDHALVLAAVVATLTAFPVLYLKEWQPFAAMGAMGLFGVGAVFARLDDPAVLFLLVGSTGLNLFFLALVVKTHAQVFHGLIALSNGVAILALPWAFENATNGTTLSWGAFAAITAPILVLCVVLYSPLSRVAATPRRLSPTARPES